MGECTLETILKASKKCEYVLEACGDSNSINMFELRFCTLSNSPYIFVALALIVLLTSFYILSTVSDQYLSPILGGLSKRLKLSEAVSGVTILAFANGAPDVISSFSAGGESEGIFISIGSLFGACLFASSVVLGVCILYSKTGIYMDGANWLRDIVFYILSGRVGIRRAGSHRVRAGGGDNLQHVLHLRGHLRVVSRR